MSENFNICIVLPRKLSPPERVDTFEAILGELQDYFSILDTVLETGSGADTTELDGELWRSELAQYPFVSGSVLSLQAKSRDGKRSSLLAGSPGYGDEFVVSLSSFHRTLEPRRTGEQLVHRIWRVVRKYTGVLVAAGFELEPITTVATAAIQLKVFIEEASLACWVLAPKTVVQSIQLLPDSTAYVKKEYDLDTDAILFESTNLDERFRPDLRATH